MTERGTVLVTGGSGFIGGWCIIQLIQQGWRVRTTVRSLSREKEVRGWLSKQVELGDKLTFFAADLLSDEGWSSVVPGCDYVLHVASPFPLAEPKHESELVTPARDGTLRVLKAAKNAGVKRIVVTSSMAAIAYNDEPKERYTEEDWTIPEKAKHAGAYVRSKAIAERAAWDWMGKFGGGMEMAVVNPVAVLGPVLTDDMSSSIQLVSLLMNGAMPACPRVAYAVVDVRDVADLHIRAMTDPKAAGQRFAAVTGEPLWISEMGQILQDKLGPAAKQVPTKTLPDWVVRVGALVNPTMKVVAGSLGRRKPLSNEKAKTLLGWQPRTPEETIVSCAQSLLDLGLVKGQEAKAA